MPEKLGCGEVQDIILQALDGSAILRVLDFALWLSSLE